MHSPVWQDYDPALDTAEVWSDWEYYSDDYYDGDSPRKRRKVDDGKDRSTGQGDMGSALRRKRRKFHSSNAIPELSLGDSVYPSHGNGESVAPVVVWKSKTEPDDVPVVSEGQEEKVALLKDWRERFGVPSQASVNPSKAHGVIRRGSQTALAVVIEQKASVKGTRTKGATTDSSKNRGIPSRAKVTQPRTNSTATTASSAAKQRQKAGETLNHTTATKPASKPSSRRAASTKSERTAPANSLKRNASTLTKDDAATGIDDRDTKRLNITKAIKAIQENSPPKQDTLSGPVISETAKKRDRPKTDTSILPVPSKGSTRITKSVDTKTAVLEPLPNGNIPSKAVGITNAETRKEAQLGASKGSLRKRKAEDLLNGDAEPPAKRNASRPRGRPPISKT